MENRKFIGESLAITAAIAWGIMGIFARNLGDLGYSGINQSFVRCSIAFLAFFILKLATNKNDLKIDLRGLGISFLYGIVAYAIGFSFYSISVSRIPVAVAIVLMFMSPVWVALLSKVIFKEEIGKKKITSIFICLTGAIFVSGVLGSSIGSIDFIGILAGVLNGVGVALQIIVPKKFSEYKKDTMLVYGFLGAAIFLFFFEDQSIIINTIVNKTAIIDILGLGVVCTMVANVAIVKATEYIDATSASILSAIEVVVGMLVGFLIFKESLSYVQMIGCILVVFGALYAQMPDKKLFNPKKKFTMIKYREVN